MTDLQRQPFSVSDLWSNMPTAFKGGLVVAVVAWFVSLSSAQTSTLNGEVISCSYFDVVKVGGAVLLLVLAVAGFRANSKARRALPIPLAAVIAAVLLAFAVLLALKGLGVAMSPCQP